MILLFTQGRDCVSNVCARLTPSRLTPSEKRVSMVILHSLHWPRPRHVPFVENLQPPVSDFSSFFQSHGHVFWSSVIFLKPSVLALDGGGGDRDRLGSSTLNLRIRVRLCDQTKNQKNPFYVIYIFFFKEMCHTSNLLCTCIHKREFDTLRY